MNQFKKTCKICGREFQWRKKWQSSWQQVKNCSRACRKADLTDVDINLEKGQRAFAHEQAVATMST